MRALRLKLFIHTELLRLLLQAYIVNQFRPLVGCHPVLESVLRTSFYQENKFVTSAEAPPRIRALKDRDR